MRSKFVPIIPLMSLVILPGLATTFYGVWTLLGLPNGIHILGVLSFISLLSGTYVSVTKTPLFPAAVDGEFNVIETDTGSTYSLDLDTNPEDLPRKKSITFRVKKDTHK